jgi:FkbM family methyltransferase
MSQPAMTQARYGKMALFEHDGIVSEAIRQFGEWAQAELDLLQRFIRPGDCVLDCGAYIGTHTLAFAAMTGDVGRVIAFEPRRESFALLHQNCAGLENVIVLENCALGAAPGTLRLTPMCAILNPGALAIEDAPAADASAYPVELRTIDGLALPRADFIKLDVEGAEAAVLSGATNTIAKFRPIVLAEANALHTAVPVLQFMTDRGYRSYGCLFPAFNPANFAGQPDTMFRGAAETALLFVPAERAAGVAPHLPAGVDIDTIDSLALLLLHKPQYPYEVLQRQAAAQGLGLLYPSPALAKLRQQSAAAPQAENVALAALIRDMQKLLDAARAAALPEHAARP